MNATKVFPAFAIVLAPAVITLITRLVPLPNTQNTKLPSKITIATENEPGERLVVSGTVYIDDSKTPLADAEVYVYHTDVDGYYNRSAGDRGNSNPRLNGRMHTDANGAYEFRTIKPGPYPDSRIAAHIHYAVSAPGYKERKLELLFEGDEFITARMREESKSPDGFYHIRALEKNAKGMLACRLDVVLNRQ